MKRNGIAILALILCLLCLALTALVWLNADQAFKAQETRLTQLEKDLAALDAQLEQLEAAGELELKDYTLTAKAWTDGTGADVTLTAWPEAGWADMELTFVAETIDASGEVRTTNVLCHWDGEAYTATASLEASDLYTYYLSAGEGNWVPLAGSWGNRALDCVYLADSLTGYVTFELQSWAAEERVITLQQGFGIAQLPLFDSQGAGVTANGCAFVLKLEEAVLDTAVIQPTAGEAESSLEILAQGVTLTAPELSDGQQVELWLCLELSDGRTLETWVCGWTMNGGRLGQVAG